VTEDLAQLFLTAQRMPFENVLHDGVDDRSLLSGFPADPCGIVNNDHRHGDRKCKQRRVETDRQTNAMSGGSDQRRVRGGHTAGAEQQRPIPISRLGIMHRHLQDLGKRPG
jgi:hypothetical protein